MDSWVKARRVPSAVALISSFALFGLMSPARASDDAMTGDSSMASMASSGIQTAHRLIGLPVKNDAGVTVGTFTDFYLTNGDDQIRCAILSNDGSQSAVQWDELRLHDEGMGGRFFTLKAGSAREPGTVTGFYSYNDLIGWSVRSSGLTLPGSAGGMENASMNNGRTEGIGRIAGAAVDVRTGRVPYLLVSLAGDNVGDLSGKQVALPWSALTVYDLGRDVVAKASLADLRQFAFDKGQMPNLSNLAYASLLNSAFGTSEWQVYGYVGGPASMDRFGRYDSAKVTTLSGDVIADSGNAAQLAGDLGHFSVKAADNSVCLVIVAPKSFIEKHRLAFNPGDRVTVTGTEETNAGALRILLAGRIEMGKNVTVLRDAAGWPVWQR